MCPSLLATETTSIDVSPPPTHITFFDPTLSLPSQKASKKSTPVIQLVASPPSTGIALPFQHPIVHKTASCDFSTSSSFTSLPTLFPRTISMSPRLMILSISLSKRSLGVL